MTECRSYPGHGCRTNVSRIRAVASYRYLSDSGVAISARVDCAPNEVALPGALDRVLDLGAALNKLRRIPHRRAAFRRDELAKGIADATVRLGDVCYHRRALDGQSPLA